MIRFICRVLRLDELKPMLGLSILELTPQEQEEMLAMVLVGHYQLSLF